MIKQRLLGLALSLALLATSGFGLTRVATAAPGDVLVSATLTSSSSVSLSSGTINFGQVNPLGTISGGANVQDSCAISNGHRYVSDGFTATVSSSTKYNFGIKMAGPPSGSVNVDFAVGTGIYADCNHYVSTGPGVLATHFISNGWTTPFQLQSGKPATTSGDVDIDQFFLLDVTTAVGLTTGTFSTTFVYVITPAP